MAASLIPLLAQAAGAAAPGEERADRSVRATQDATTTAAKPAANSKTTSAKKKKKAAARPLAPEPARIREIQQALAREGYYHEEPSGKWDEASVAAMKEFQTAKGLPATGKLEALSLQKLGLGSPVAGVAAPEPRSAGDPAPAPTKPTQ